MLNLKAEEIQLSPTLTQGKSLEEFYRECKMTELDSKWNVDCDYAVRRAFGSKPYAVDNDDIWLRWGRWIDMTIWVGGIFAACIFFGAAIAVPIWIAILVGGVVSAILEACIDTNKNSHDIWGLASKASVYISKFTKQWRASAVYPPRPKLDKVIDFTSPDVIEDVMEFIMTYTRDEQGALLRKIEDQQLQVSNSIKELGNICAWAAKEIAFSKDESHILMVASRADAAKRVLSKLEAQQSTLSDQYTRAKSCLSEIEAQYDMLKRVHAKTLDIQRIQKALNVSDSAEDFIADNELQLERLLTLSKNVKSEMDAIAEVVDITSSSRLEVALL